MMQQMEYLRQRPGFQFADVGYKYIQHERTDFIAVRIYVDRKRDDDGIIEKTCYHEFVPTDVIECRFEKAVAQTNAGDKLRSDGNAGFGTLGMGVDYFGTPHFLTCAHVVSDQQPPSTAVNYVTDINNTLVGRSKNSDDGFYRYDGSFDLALLLPSNFVATDELGLFKYPLEPGLAKPTRISNVGSTDLLRPVYKIGAKTGLRRGHIDSVDPGPIPIADSPDALNHIVIVSNSSQQPFAEPGDSGSVVITDNGEIIGMVRAVQIGTRERTVVTRMFEIAASFGINAPLG